MAALGLPVKFAKLFPGKLVAKLLGKFGLKFPALGFPTKFPAL